MTPSLLSNQKGFLNKVTRSFKFHQEWLGFENDYSLCVGQVCNIIMWREGCLGKNDLINPCFLLPCFSVLLYILPNVMMSVCRGYVDKG